MCGIAGFISNNYSKEHLEKMINSIKHRGPDAKGVFFNSENGIGLGHRRLSIIDLSEAANQPMKSHCGRFIMVYNGEVYNFKEVAKKLNTINWKTSSDSEVILEAFVKWGNEFVNQLNGMFAIAIYDLLENKLFLFRDRMGIKPLYYYYKDGELIFASELKAINQIKKNKDLNYNSIYSFLHLGYIPSNSTVYKYIYKLNPGSYIEYNDKIINEKKYWNFKDKLKTKTDGNFNTSKKELKKLLEKSVERRLISDVPIGTFLSGGIDSSLVTSIAQEVNKGKINTFSIGFEESKYNESQHAKKVAQYLGTNHNEFILKEKDALDEIESIMDNFDEPFADSSALPTMLVSKMARKHVTVCLSGDGGDELFMGYGAYNWAKRLSNPLIWSSRKKIAWLLSKSNNTKFKRAGLVFNSTKQNCKSHIFSQEQYLFSELEISKLLKVSNNSMVNKINETTLTNRKLNPVEKQSFFDLNNYLINDLLVKVDRSSMYTSLEVRVPLLDHEVIEYAININDKSKIFNGTQKYILKQLLYDYIPKSIMDRPKWGFSIPLEKWLKYDLNFLIEKYLNEIIIKEQEVINYQEVKLIIKRFNNGETYLYNRIWSLIILTKFLSK